MLICYPDIYRQLVRAEKGFCSRSEHASENMYLRKIPEVIQRERKKFPQQPVMWYSFCNSKEYYR